MTVTCRIKVEPEGRHGVWLADKESLKEFIRSKGWTAIHNFAGNSMIRIGADHSVESVLDDIDHADRVGLLTDGSERQNMGHALALVTGARLECYDIGKIRPDDLLPSAA